MYKVARKKVEIQPGLIEPKFSQVPIRYSVTEPLKLAITLFLRFLISLQWSCDCTLLACSLGDNAATPNVIGASLSEPHTSVTSLRTRVCIYACLDRPLTEMSAYFNITEIELVAIARVQGQLPGVAMTEVEARMATYSLFAIDHQRHRQYKF